MQNRSNYQFHLIIKHLIVKFEEHNFEFLEKIHFWRKKVFQW